MTKYTTSMLPSSPKPLKAPLLALLLGLLLSCAVSVFAADDLPEVQRLMKQGQLPQALEKVDAYVAGKPKDPQGRFLKGLILTEMGRSAEAMAVFGKLTEDFPELPEPYNNLAVLHAQQKQYDKARTALEMAIRTHPGYATAYENLGDVYAKLAGQAYEKALQLEASNKGARSKLSMIRELTGNPASAEIKPGGASRPAGEPVKTATAEVRKGGAPSPAGDEAEVRRALEDWAGAWSRKEVKAYLDFYAPDFQTPDGLSRQAWEADRAQRIGKPDKLLIELDDVNVIVEGDRATVRFRQRYSSPTAKGSVGKTLIFMKSRGKWLIQQENTA